MNEKIKTQILAIHDSGVVNMFAMKDVQRIAFELDFYELVNLIESSPKTYVTFILTGKY